MLETGFADQMDQILKECYSCERLCLSPFVCIFVCVRVHACVSVCVHAYMHVYVRVCVCTCVVHMCTITW